MDRFINYGAVCLLYLVGGLVAVQLASGIKAQNPISISSAQDGSRGGGRCYQLMLISTYFLVHRPHWLQS